MLDNVGLLMHELHPYSGRIGSTNNITPVYVGRI